MYARPDGSVVDGFEALVEHLSGAPCTYPVPRYDRPIRMRSGAFAEQPVPGQPGVSVRQLGRFNESGPDVSVLRLATGAQVPPVRAVGDELRIVISGSIRTGEEILDGIAFAYAPDGARKPPLVAQSASEVLRVRYNIPFQAAL
jgi:hypothetical protein